MMPDTSISRCAWRLDRLTSPPDATRKVEETQEGAGPGELMLESHSAPRPKRCDGDRLPRLGRRIHDWLRCRLGRKRRGRVQFEALIHRFAASIDQTDDPAVVEAELLRAVRQMMPSSRIEIVPEEESHDAEQAANLENALGPGGPAGSTSRALEVPLRCGGAICGRLRIHLRTRDASSYPVEDLRRLTTLGTIAACAMEGLGLFTEWPQANLVTQERAQAQAAGRAVIEFREPASPLQDATFLNAVLPFALSQARRHREPLSIVCVAVDRLSAIKQLLGSGESDRLVQHVAHTVRAVIRSSDIVARLDDDRVVAVLPRARAAAQCTSPRTSVVPWRPIHHKTA